MRINPSINNPRIRLLLAVLPIMVMVTCIDSLAQVPDTLEDGKRYIRLDGPYEPTGDVLWVFLVGEKKIEILDSEMRQDSIRIDYDLINSISILKHEAAKEKYGLQGKDGVIICELIKGSRRKLSKKLKKKLKPIKEEE